MLLFAFFLPANDNSNEVFILRIFCERRIPNQISLKHLVPTDSQEHYPVACPHRALLCIISLQGMRFGKSYCSVYCKVRWWWDTGDTPVSCGWLQDGKQRTCLDITRRRHSTFMNPKDIIQPFIASSSQNKQQDSCHLKTFLRTSLVEMSFLYFPDEFAFSNLKANLTGCT